MTATRRILLQVAGGASLVIAVATAVTYNLVYEGARQRDLQHIETYVTERSRREEFEFQQIQANLTLVRGQFLKRMEAPVPADFQARWDERFEHFPDGAWRSRRQFSDGRKWSTLWAHRDTRLTPEVQIQILRAQDICDELMPGWIDSFVSLYFVFHGPLNIGFDPRIPSWVWDTPADYDVTGLAWFQLAVPVTPPPPDRISWTGVIEEPTSGMPIVSVYLPIMLNGRFLGSVGHDLNLEAMMGEVTRTELTGAMHMVFREDGRLIAHPSKRREILSSKGLLRMQDVSPAMASLYHTVNLRHERQFSGYDETSGSYYCVARLSGPGWLFLTTISRDQLQQQAFQSAQWVLWSGLVSLALVLGFLAMILRRQIAQPLAELARATKQMAALDTSARAAVDRHDEFGDLANAFNDMAGRIAARGTELRQLNQELEQRVSQRTSELTEANRRLDEGREEALRLLARERELREMKSDFVTLVSHEFRTPLEIIMSSVDNLDRYHDRLPPEKREQLLRTINKAVRRMSGMMEEALVLGGLETHGVTFRPKPFEFHSFCHRLCDEIESSTSKRCPIRLELDGAPQEAVGDESIVRHILTNLLSNAVKYSPAGAPVDFSVSAQGDRAVFSVADRGCGIPVADQQRLFQAFHRGSNVRQIPGTGLGLLIVRRCVDLHGGTLGFASTEGQGSTFTVQLPLFGRETPS